jgi:hypothetical protein
MALLGLGQISGLDATPYYRIISAKKREGFARASTNLYRAQQSELWEMLHTYFGQASR